MRLGSLSALLLGCSMACAHANTPADYAYAFPLELDSAAEQGSAWRVDLTPAVYAFAQDPALGDVEIFNAAGRPVPLARWMAPATSTSTVHSALLPALALPTSMASESDDLHLVIDRDASGRLRRIDTRERATATAPVTAQARDWLLDASAFERPMQRIVLNWSAPSSGVVARFAVAASDDLQQWRDVGSASVLALQREGAQLERRDIALDGVRAKYIRLHRLDDGPELIDLGAQAQSTERIGTAPPRAWLDIAPAEADAAARKPLQLDYALPAALPVDTIRIRLVAGDTLAPLVLRVRSPGHEWRELARVDAFRLRVGDEMIENEDIRLSVPVRMGELRIESSAALTDPPRVTLGYHAESFVFIAEGEAPYLLAVGSAQARHADYPVEIALAGVRAKLGQDWQPPQVRLGDMRESAGASALHAPTPPTPWRRWLLWGVLAIGAAAVGGIALSLLRSTRSGDGETS